ncbi:MAG: Gfo/Idh/MocA family oxidoreductase [Bacteroidota bacterium]
MPQTRRSFVKTVTAATAGASLASVSAASYARIVGANERIRVGVLGCGRLARGHTRGLRNRDDAQVVALSDVYQPNLDAIQGNAPGADAYRDFRQVLERDDVDLAFIASPDHWHPLMAVMAADAGKHVYVEKPTSVAVHEGRKMVEAARRNDRRMQVGTQQRSQFHFQEVVDLVQSGILGEVSMVRCWNYSNNYPNGMGSPADASPPDGLDWDLWLGPAPEVPFNINRFGVVLNDEGQYQRWASFRHFWDYAGGMMTDWGVHHLDIVQWAMGVDAPTHVGAVGGKFYLQDNRDTPDTLLTTYQYPGFVCLYENRLCNALPLGEQRYGLQFHGTQATLFVNRQFYEIMPERGSDVQPVRKEAWGGGVAEHFTDLFDAIRDGRNPLSDIEAGHRSSSTAILGTLAYRTGTSFGWDGAAEQSDNDAVNAMLMREYRQPWSLG